MRGDGGVEPADDAIKDPLLAAYRLTPEAVLFVDGLPYRGGALSRGVPWAKQQRVKHTTQEARQPQIQMVCFL